MTLKEKIQKNKIKNLKAEKILRNKRETIKSHIELFFAQ